MVQVPPLGRLFFVALWSAADDHGCVYDEPERLAMEVMPREDPLEVDEWLQFFWAAGKLDLFVNADGATYWRIRSWEDHQRIDHPAKSKMLREASQKLTIPHEVRREVAKKYGCDPGHRVAAECFYCRAEGRVSWPTLRNNKPGAWVTFPGLELDHLESESEGGENSCENMVLACRGCNRRKGTKLWFEWMARRNGKPVPREDSRGLALEGKGKEQGISAELELESPAKTDLRVIVLIPLVDGTDYPITEKEVAEFTVAFPAIDVVQELREMRAWCIGNKPNRKTRTGVLRFVTRWLSRAQDDAARRPEQSKPRRGEFEGVA